VSTQPTTALNHWYVVQTKPKQETRAELNLRNWGLQVFAPKIRERCVRRVSGPTPYSVSPLFPCYIFAKFDAEALLQKVDLTRGVHHVVRFAGCAASVPDDVIAAIESRTEDGFVRIAEPCPGDTVQIVEGPLRRLTGIFERELSGTERVLILLSTLGCQARVKISKAFIQKIDVNTLLCNVKG
jgi:transcriptional antiterminator RfaH